MTKDDGRKTQMMQSWSESQTTEASLELLMPDRDRTPPSLRQVTGPGAKREVVLSRPKMVIGRSKAADVTVDSPELSRHHVVLERDGHETVVTDLDSRNGLYLNGIRIHACVLRAGDAIQLGNVTFIYQEVG